MYRIILVILVFFFNISTPHSKEVNIFSDRHYDSDHELYKKFTKQTGIKVNIFSGKGKQLEKRILEEGVDCKADLLIVADAGRLYSAEKKNLFQKIDSEVLNEKIPSHLRTEFWYGIAKRSRIIYYNPEFTNYKDVKKLSYEDLSNKRWRKKILIRQSNNIYNQSLVASLIENNGEEKTFQWLKSLVKNMAKSPSGNDRTQILGVAAGEAELAVANSYYYALMLSGKKGNDQKRAAEKVRPLFPNQENRGTHMNISGGGILKFAKNKTNAIKLLEFLVTKDAQKHIVVNTFEYPIRNDVKPHKIIEEMGNFKQDVDTEISSYGKNQAKAKTLMLKAGWR